jgi:PadR family transcriptional regulator PadR
VVSFAHTPASDERQALGRHRYPGDNTPVCKRQFCSYRDRADDFATLDATVVGISAQGSARCLGSRFDIASWSIYTVAMGIRAMQEATFLILTALAGGSQHGYGIITDVEQISDGRVRLRAGTLYTALDRLRADRLIEVDREEIVENRLRRYYRLTSPGERRLADEAARLQANAVVALSRLRPAGAMR